MQDSKSSNHILPNTTNQELNKGIMTTDITRVGICLKSWPWAKPYILTHKDSFWKSQLETRWVTWPSFLCLALCFKNCSDFGWTMYTSPSHRPGNSILSYTTHHKHHPFMRFAWLLPLFTYCYSSRREARKPSPKEECFSPSPGAYLSSSHTSSNGNPHQIIKEHKRREEKNV